MNNRPTILAVDDNSVSLVLLDKILAAEGYQVHQADSGELALAIVDANPPDLILLDVCMEGVDGLEVCRQLKAREETRHIPIILISASAEVRDCVKGLQLGAADYITKPFHREELLTRVKTHLSLYQANLFLKQQAAALKDSEQFLHASMNALSAHIAILDESGQILFVNRAWRDFAITNSVDPMRVCEGVNYLAVCDASEGNDTEIARCFSQGLRSVLSGTNTKFEMEYPCHSPTEQRWFCGRVTAFSVGDTPHVAVAHENLTERKRMEAALRQSEERHRALFNSSQDAIMTIEPPLWQFASGNPACIAMFGAKDEAEFTSHGPGDLSP
jgi:CheY-like chemotaxis protein